MCSQADDPSQNGPTLAASATEEPKPSYKAAFTALLSRMKVIAADSTVTTIHAARMVAVRAVREAEHEVAALAAGAGMTIERDTLRAVLRVAITNAYYDARNAGETMETAADRATDGVLAALAASATDEDYTAAAGMMRVTAEDIRASLRALGPTGDRAEAIVRAAAESVAVAIENRLAASATDERTIGRPGEYVGWAGPAEPRSNDDRP